MTPTLIYRFNDAAAYRLLESASTARARVTLRAGCPGKDAFLRVVAQRQVDDAPEIAAVITLPLIAVDGNPERLLLDVLGDASSGCVSLEAVDARGRGLAYSFGAVDFSGWRTLTAEVQRPSEYWGQRRDDGTSEVVPPVQPLRLEIQLGEECDVVDIGLGALSVIGSVRLTSPAIATRETDEL